ncbi:MAG TPA: hypothetical protein VG870_03315 [Chitinophagaceae bacterium]|nr:hypothetical protein [Chitinophagaceae bacterium]
MKKAAIFAAALFLFSMTFVSAQETYASLKNPTVDSINAKYNLLPMPAPMAMDQVFPALGEYQSSMANAPASVKIVLDDQNKGMVWVEGLPQGRIKAMLRKSPSTYKIPAQKTAEGNEVPEGTLVYDKDSRKLSICLGRPYNDQDPASAFAPVMEEPVAVAPAKHVKGKKDLKPAEQPKPWLYEATKVEHATAMNQ